MSTVACWGHRFSSIPTWIRMTNLRISFVLFPRRLRRCLWQRIVPAVQTLGDRADGIAPGIVGAQFTSRLFFSHIYLLTFAAVTVTRAVTVVTASSNHSHTISSLIEITVAESNAAMVGERPGFQYTVFRERRRRPSPNAWRRGAMYLDHTLNWDSRCGKAQKPAGQQDARQGSARVSGCNDSTKLESRESQLPIKPNVIAIERRELTRRRCRE